MKTISLLTLVLSLVCSAVVSASAGESAQGLNQLDALVGRWMNLRTTLATEKREWLERKNQWEQEIGLLGQELTVLEQEWQQGQGETSSFEQKQADLLAEKQRLADLKMKLSVAVSASEKRLRTWEKLIPAGLLPRLADGFRALPAEGTQPDTSKLNQRAQVVIALWTGIEELQNDIHSTLETLETSSNSRRQVEVLYLGLARGYAVSADNQWAAVGTPGSDGWTWKETPEFAERFRLALELANRRETAELVGLPVSVATEVKP